MNAKRMSALKLEELTSTTPAMSRCLKLAALAAKSGVPVLLLGETGTGKTLLAQAIHNSSARAGKPFVSFNASAVSDTLLESQLFGHERGAFTGAHRAVKGKFELADTGTLFLDEIAEMSALAQAKILRAIEYGEFERLGSERMLRCNVRVIAATHSSLRERIREGRFREDLYQRLNGVTLLIPPLRERREELPGLIAAELQAAAREAGKTITAIHPAAMEKLLAHPWPGNLRELHHTLRVVALFCDGQAVLPEHIEFAKDLDPCAPSPAETLAAAHAHPARQGDGHNGGNGELSLAHAVCRHIRAVYEQTHRNQRRTAKLLGISRPRLVRHLKRMDLK